jgi:methionyl-tRNA formyltransferase
MTPQDDAAATYCRKLQKEDGGLDFSASAAVLAARINGLFPWPCCAVELNGQRVKLGLADVAENPGGAVLAGAENESPASGTAVPGEILGADESGLLVATGSGVLRLRKLQRPGGRMLSAAEFLRGFAVAPRTQLLSRIMPSLVARR